MAGGAKANERWAAFCRNIEQSLSREGELMPFKLEPVPSDPLGIINAHQCVDRFGGRGWYARDVPLFRGCCDTTVSVDFVFCRQDWQRPVALWAKSQESRGSVDGKLFRILAEVPHCPLPACLLLVGDGLLSQAGLIRHVARVAASPGSKIRRVFHTIDEFRNWCSDGMPELPPAPAHGLFAVAP